MSTGRAITSRDSRAPLGLVKPRRSAPPPSGLAGLTRTSAAPKAGSYVVARQVRSGGSTGMRVPPGMTPRRKRRDTDTRGRRGRPARVRRSEARDGGRPASVAELAHWTDGDPVLRQNVTAYFAILQEWSLTQQSECPAVEATGP